MRREVTCCVPELRTLLKQRVASIVAEEPIAPEIEMLMERLRETFFSEARVRVIKRFIQTSKLMKNLVHLIFAVVCLILNLEREFSFDNLLGLTEQP